MAAGTVSVLPTTAGPLWSIDQEDVARRYGKPRQTGADPVGDAPTGRAGYGRSLGVARYPHALKHARHPASAQDGSPSQDGAERHQRSGGCTAGAHCYGGRYGGHREDRWQDYREDSEHAWVLPMMTAEDESAATASAPCLGTVQQRSYLFTAHRLYILTVLEHDTQSIVDH